MNYSIKNSDKNGWIESKNWPMILYALQSPQRDGSIDHEWGSKKTRSQKIGKIAAKSRRSIVPNTGLLNGCVCCVSGQRWQWWWRGGFWCGGFQWQTATGEEQTPAGSYKQWQDVRKQCNDDLPATDMDTVQHVEDDLSLIHSFHWSEQFYTDDLIMTGY